MSKRKNCLIRLIYLPKTNRLLEVMRGRVLITRAWTTMTVFCDRNGPRLKQLKRALHDLYQ